MAGPGALGLMSATVFAASEAKENNTTLMTDEVLPLRCVLGGKWHDVEGFYYSTIFFSFHSMTHLSPR